MSVIGSAFLSLENELARLGRWALLDALKPGLDRHAIQLSLATRGL